MDNGPVCMMTTIHDVKGQQSEVYAICKKPGPKSTNTGGVRKSGMWKIGEWAALTKIPTVINDYNLYMNRVD